MPEQMSPKCERRQTFHKHGRKMNKSSPIPVDELLCSFEDDACQSLKALAGSEKALSQALLIRADC